MNIVAEMTLRDLRGAGLSSTGSYASALRDACDVAPPPFGTKAYGDIYRAVSVDPTWLAVSIMTSAEREADGAERLWTLAACTPDPEVSAPVKQHAIDESRHARWYIAALENTFPGAVDESLRQQLRGLSPRFTAAMSLAPVDGSLFAHAVSMDDLVQMNIAEIRTGINQRLQRPVMLVNCPPHRRRKLTVLLDRLIRDEIRHIAYSARLIERFAEDEGQDVLVDLMCERLQDFNEITCSEVEDREFPLHCSRKECHGSGDVQGTCALTGRSR